MKARNLSLRPRYPREGRPVRIIADGAISSVGTHGGRLLPLVLLDTTDRPDIAELIRVHQTTGPGDVRAQWGQIDDHPGTVAAFCNFIRPVELFMILEFKIVAQGILVEHALMGQGIYIARAESHSDRLTKNIDRAKVIVELPDQGFRKIWDKLFMDHMVKHFKGEGLSRAPAREAARLAITEFRKLGSLRARD
jgi:hypothetical protein